MNIIKNFLEKRKEKRFVDTSEQDFTVKLKPIFNISPSIYLRVFLGILILILCFFLFVFPGLKNNGSLVSFSSSPSNSAVYIDGKYAGATPLKRFIPKGDHEFQLKYTGSAPNSQGFQIKGRVFFSKLFPKRKKIDFDVENIDPMATAKGAYEQFSLISCYHSFEKGTVPPPIITYGVEKILKATDSNQGKEALEFLFERALPLGNTPELKEDLFNALLLASSFSHNVLISSYSYDKYLEAGKLLISLSNEYPQLFFDYYFYFTPQQRKEIRDSTEFQTYKDRLIFYCNLPSTKNFGVPTGKTVEKGGLLFREYYGGIIRDDDLQAQNAIFKLSEDGAPSSIPTVYQFSNYFISDNFVTGDEFQDFIDSDGSVLNNWVEKGEINQYFNPSSGQSPVIGISWFCAEDFAISKETRLPHFLELQKANLSHDFFYEWNQDSFIPSMFSDKSFFPERVISLNTPEDQKIKRSFSSFPANFCTDSTSFRLAFSSKKMVILNLDMLGQ